MDMKAFPLGLICPAGTTTLNKLTKTEFLVFCPYDPSHRVINNRYVVHLERCRRNYVLEMQEKNRSDVMSNCSLNPDHQVYTPELSYHEHNCIDKGFALVENIYFKDVPRWEEALCFAEAEQKRLLKEATEPEIDAYLEKMSLSAAASGGESRHDGDLDKMTEYFIKLIKERPAQSQVHKMRRGDRENVPKKEEETMTAPFRNKLVCKQFDHVLDQTKDEGAFGYIYRKPRVHKRVRLQKLKMVNEEVTLEDPNDDNLEEWTFDDKGPGYSWLEHQFNLKGLVRIFPPGLTKAQRRKWEKEETIRLMCEEGFFVPEDLEKEQQRVKEANESLKKLTEEEAKEEDESLKKQNTKKTSEDESAQKTLEAGGAGKN